MRPALLPGADALDEHGAPGVLHRTAVPGVIEFMPSEDAAVLSVEVLLRFERVGARCKNGYTMSDFALLAVRGHRGAEVAYVARGRLDSGVEKNLDIFAPADFPDEILDILGYVFALPRIAQVQGMPAKLILRLDDARMEALICQREGAHHPGHSAPDHQRRRGNRDRRHGKRFDELGAGDAHPNQVLGFFGCRIGFGCVHPRTLVAYIGLLEEVLVKAGVAHRLLEERLVRTRRAGGNDHPVEVLLLYDLHQPILGILGTGEEVFLDVDDIWKRLCVFDDFGNPDNTRYVYAAIADEYTDLRRLRTYVALLRESFFPDQRVSRPGKFARRSACGSRSFHNRKRDVFGTL